MSRAGNLKLRLWSKQASERREEEGQEELFEDGEK